MSCPKVDLIFIDSGGGHRAAATALTDVIRDLGFDWDIRMVSIQELLASIDVVRTLTGIDFQDVYNIMLRRGWTAAAGPMIPTMHAAIRIFHRSQVRVLARQWAVRKPDLVVSLIPHFNRAIKQSLDCACPGTPFVTILTDIADYPPNFWIERQDQYVVCGSDAAIAQARASGPPPGKVLRASGMIVHPRFYEHTVKNRVEERARLGLSPNLPTGLVLFGGQGSKEILEIAQRLNNPDCGVQLIVLCGKNERLARELRELDWRLPVYIEGFTDRVPFYMELANFFIGKPGPGSISEAIVKMLPLIVRCDRRTLPQERYNAEWIMEEGIGIAISSYDELRDAVRDLLDPQNYARRQARLSSHHNEAVYEIPGMLKRMLPESSRVSPELQFTRWGGRNRRGQSGAIPGWLERLPRAGTLSRPRRGPAPLALWRDSGAEVPSLPCFPEMRDEEVEWVVESLPQAI